MTQMDPDEASSPEAPIMAGDHADTARLNFVRLPAELIDSILALLSPFDLVAVSGTCRTLNARANSDHQWQRLVQRHVPHTKVVSPSPCTSFRDLYAAHDPHWFIPEHRIWFSDAERTGRLLVARFDPGTGNIEAYQMTASRNDPQEPAESPWSADPHVTICHFTGNVGLNWGKPIVRFRVQDRKDHRESPFAQRVDANRFSDETPMWLTGNLQGMYSNFILAKALPRDVALARLSVKYPYGSVWPAPWIPSQQHFARKVFHLQPENPDMYQPRNRAEMSSKAFRVKSWVEMFGSPTPITGLAPLPTGGVHIGEEVSTYVTLRPELYTPTPTKPWRGIWVGDYRFHGCEFLLLHQPEDVEDSPDQNALEEELHGERNDEESDEEWQRRQDAQLFRGELLGIKLTGDPHIPRGEISFVAEDLGVNGQCGYQTHEPFKGAMTVKCRGHIAANGFYEDTWMTTALIFPDNGTDKLAHYWPSFGMISYLRRVKLDEMSSMLNTHPPEESNPEVDQ